MTKKMNCWEFKKCGKEKTADCPAVIRKAGRYCWLVAGTLCGGKPQGIFVEKAGSCFQCDFYRYVRGRDAVMPRSYGLHSPASTNVMRTVLLVGGSPSMRQTVTFALGNAGYRVVTAATGEDAFRELETERIQVVITDPETDETDGAEFIHHLRSRHEYRFTPVVMLASELHESGTEKAKKAGVSGWVIKPFTPGQLVEVVRKFAR